ncbi:protein of unknown function (plasmid) [Caballeronia sp. S22]
MQLAIASDQYDESHPHSTAEANEHRPWTFGTAYPKSVRIRSVRI